MTPYLDAGNTGKYILCSKDIYVEFRGFMFSSLSDMKLCQSELEDFLRCFANLLSNGWTSKLYSSSPWNSTERHGEQIAKEQNGVTMESSHNPESPLPTVLGTSPWPFKAAFHECRTSTGWMTCEKKQRSSIVWEKTPSYPTKNKMIWQYSDCTSLKGSFCPLMYSSN